MRNESFARLCAAVRLLALRRQALQLRANIKRKIGKQESEKGGKKPR